MDTSKGFFVSHSGRVSTAATDFEEGRGALTAPAVPLVRRADDDLAFPPPDLSSDLSMSTTVLLAADEHRALTRWCGRAAHELGRPNLASHEVVRGLVARLVADPRLAADLLADFREQAGITEIQRFAAW